jgi:hypothetical protein
MAQSDPYWLAAVAAEQVLKDRSIVSLPIDPVAIATGLGIKVMPKDPRSPGVSGMLIRVGNEFGIGYATHINSAGFRRFSIAHELGHFFLPGHIDAVFVNDDIHESHAGFASGERYEMEADHFSAGILMPRTLFVPALRQSGSGLAAIEKLSNLCQTSMPATAIRFAQCTSDPVAIVISTGNKVEYCFMSSALKGVSGIDWIRKGQAVPRGTPTFIFNGDSDNVQGGARVEDTSNLSDWFNGKRSIEISEAILGLGGYGKTLTVLYDIELPDEDEEAEEEAMVESWATRFRK